MHPSDRWGPFADDIEPAERRARLRALHAIAHLLLGPRGTFLKDCLARAEQDEGALPCAVDALNLLASRDRRGVLATYAALSQPS